MKFYPAKGGLVLGFPDAILWLGDGGCGGLCGDVGEMAGAGGLPEAEVGMEEECGACVPLAFRQVIDPNAVFLGRLMHVHPETFVYVGEESATDLHVMVQMRIHVDKLAGCLIHLACA